MIQLDQCFKIVLRLHPHRDNLNHHQEDLHHDHLKINQNLQLILHNVALNKHKKLTLPQNLEKGQPKTPPQPT